MNAHRKKIAIGATALALLVLVALFWGFSESRVDSEVAVAQLRACGADVEWVTQGGYLAGHEIPLPEEEYHYWMTIGKEWTGGNEGLVWLRDVARLKILTIGDASGIDDEGLAQMRTLSDVEDFSIVRISVSDKGLGFLHSMPRLKSLCLHGLPITDDALTGLARLTNLESISLISLEHVGDKTVAVVERLPRLRELVLARTGVSDAGLEHLNQGLEFLNLYETEVSDDGMKWLQPLSKLKVLTLTGTRVSDKGLPYLAQLPGLEVVVLGNTRVTESGVAAFLKARASTRAIRVEY